MRASIGCFLALFVAACGGTTAGTGTGALDGGTPSDGGTAGCQPACVESEVDWGANGGLVSTTVSSRVSSCTSYVHEESSDSNGDLSCTDTLQTACGATLGAGDIYAAFQQNDVVQAFANAGTNTVYGSDPRPCDGSVLQVTYQSKSIYIGGSCSSQCIQGSTCTPVPSGLRELANVLGELDQQELQTPTCKGVFP